MLIALIVACEIGFWVFLLGGLAARYLLRARRLSTSLLITAPMVDLVLLVATAIDIRQGATPSLPHVLAAVYIGVSVGFGHRLVSWTDAHFAHRFAGGPAPQPKPRHGREHAAYERAGWYRHLTAFLVGGALMGAAVLVIGEPARSDVFVQTAGLWALIVAADFLVSFSYTINPRRA